jgi:hypothetical protein
MRLNNNNNSRWWSLKITIKGICMWLYKTKRRRSPSNSKFSLHGNKYSQQTFSRCCGELRDTHERSLPFVPVITIWKTGSASQHKMKTWDILVLFFFFFRDRRNSSCQGYTRPWSPGLQKKKKLKDFKIMTTEHKAALSVEPDPLAHCTPMTLSWREAERWNARK